VVQHLAPSEETWTRADDLPGKGQKVGKLLKQTEVAGSRYALVTRREKNPYSGRKGPCGALSVQREFTRKEGGEYKRPGREKKVGHFSVIVRKGSGVIGFI